MFSLFGLLESIVLVDILLFVRFFGMVRLLLLFIGGVFVIVWRLVMLG